MTKRRDLDRSQTYIGQYDTVGGHAHIGEIGDLKVIFDDGTDIDAAAGIRNLPQLVEQGFADIEPEAAELKKRQADFLAQRAHILNREATAQMPGCQQAAKDRDLALDRRI